METKRGAFVYIVSAKVGFCVFACALDRISTSQFQLTESISNMQNLFKQTKTKSKYSFHVPNYSKFEVGSVRTDLLCPIEVIPKGILSNAELTVDFSTSPVPCKWPHQINFCSVYCLNIVFSLKVVMSRCQPTSEQVCRVSISLFWHHTIFESKQNGTNHVHENTLTLTLTLTVQSIWSDCGNANKYD